MHSWPMVQVSQRDVIALAFAHHVTQDESFLVVGNFLASGGILLQVSPALIMKVRDAYKALEKISVSTEFQIDLSDIKTKTAEASTKIKQKSKTKPHAKSSAEIEAMAEQIGKDFDNFFKSKPKDDDDEPDTKIA